MRDLPKQHLRNKSSGYLLDSACTHTHAHLGPDKGQLVMRDTKDNEFGAGPLPSVQVQNNDVRRDSAKGQQQL